MKLFLGLWFVLQLTFSQAVQTEYVEFNLKAVVRIANNEQTLSCLGALIHSEWVLTSAVCAIRRYKEELRVYFIDTNTTANGAHIENVYIHPEFNAEERLNDIALLHLAAPADQTIRIYKIGGTKPATKAYMLYWSYWLNETPNYTTLNGYISSTNTVILKNEMCQNYPVTINSDRICSHRSLACEGSEGAPLISYETNKLIGLVSVSEVQAAICSYNDNCMMPVTTYTYVVSYLSWIKQTTNILIV